MKVRKATAPGDIPLSVIKEFAQYLCIPLCDILNTSIQSGQWPKLYKTEAITPVPKQYPPETCDMLRPISILYSFNKIMESLIGEMIVSDMKATFDVSQFGNQKKTSIQHYLIRMLHRVLTSLDRNSRGEINAVLLMCIDWRQAFSRQCHFLGIQSFITNGVRPSLIPVLIGYFEDRQMFVRWHGKQSQPRKLPGSGPMGATLGILECLSQTVYQLKTYTNTLMTYLH